MPSAVESLMGVGFAPEAALRVGCSISTVTTTAATQASAGGLLKGSGDKVVNVNVAAGGHAVTLPAEADVGAVVELYNTSAANAGVIFPHVGGFINGGAVNATLALGVQAATTAAAGLRFRRISISTWKSLA
jgi:hypothetical protein